MAQNHIPLNSQIRIKRVTLYHISMQLKSPFATSYGAYTDRETVLVEAEDESGVIGWGECAAFSTPWYTEETIGTAWHMMEDFLIPLLLDSTLEHARDIGPLFSIFKRNHMAKAALETAVWDVYAKLQDLPLAKMLGGVRQEIETGVAVGLQETPQQLYRLIDRYLQEGYRRVKVKIKPGNDIELLRGIRREFPDLKLMADANSAYTLQDMEHLKRMDEFGLMMIEQPLASDDIIDHAKLQQELATPICLDESLVSYEDVRKALELGSCRVVTLKIGRVGGLTEAIRIHDLCAAHGIPVWCGGMLDTGIGRAHNIALATLPGFTLPGDISASSRYWERDVISPKVTVQDGLVRVSEKPGIGYEVDLDYIRKIATRTEIFERS